MPANKIIYGGRVLIDLTADTVSPDKLLTGMTAHDKSGAPIAGTCDFDVNSGDATAAVAEVLEGKTVYARGAKFTGGMTNRGQVKGVINAKDDAYTIQTGFHDGSGSVEINVVERAKLLPANIREGVAILGVVGTMSGTEDVHAQAGSVVPSTKEQTVLPGEGYNYLAQVTVAAIPYVESENPAGGITVTIAG